MLDRDEPPTQKPLQPLQQCLRRPAMGLHLYCQNWRHISPDIAVIVNLCPSESCPILATAESTSQIHVKATDHCGTHDTKHYGSSPSESFNQRWNEPASQGLPLAQSRLASLSSLFQ